MSTSFQFDNQTISIPGPYSKIISGQKNPPIALPFGNVLIVDTGSGASWGGGAGVDGTLKTGKDTIYEFDEISDFRNHVKGDLWWLLAQPLFRPAGLGVNGVSKIFFIKAATTLAAEMTFAPTGNSYGGGTIVMQVRDEGLIGNGTLASTNLSKGYAFTMASGVIDTAKFVLKFWRGTYKGLDQLGVSYDGVSDTKAVPQLVCQSPEFTNVSELNTWMSQNYEFNLYFKLKTYAVSGTGEVDSADKTTYTSYTLAAGGTESYAATTLLDTVLEVCADLKINFVLADDYGADAESANNLALQNFCIATSKFKPELYVAAYDTIDNFASSKTIAANYDNDSVTVVHGGITKITKTGTKLYGAIYKAAACLGREAGLEPQIPITFKNIDIDGEQHPLSDKEVKQALATGLLVSRNEGGSFDIVKGINSLQENTFILNDDGTTHSKQLKRIARQINSILIINAKQKLFKQPFGVNRNTLSERDVESFAIEQLNFLKATPTVDNLILSYQDITVTRQGDAYFLSYKFVANSEISFLFMTGAIIGL